MVASNKKRGGDALRRPLLGDPKTAPHVEGGVAPPRRRSAKSTPDFMWRGSAVLLEMKYASHENDSQCRCKRKPLSFAPTSSNID